MATSPSVRVRDHASTPVIATSPAASVQEAAELMIGHGVRRLVEDERLSGIVTLDDLAVRAGDLELAQRLTGDITRAALPGFFFHYRGG